MWGDKEEGEQEKRGDGLSSPQLGKAGARLQQGGIWYGEILPGGRREKSRHFLLSCSCSCQDLAPSLHPSSPPHARWGKVREATQLPYPVRLQLLALAQATQERFLLPTQGLSGGEEDGAPHIEPHPLGLGASGWRDVPGAA